MKIDYFSACAKINSEIYKNQLTILNFGNASIIDKKKDYIYIKASGIFTKQCKKKDIVKVKLIDTKNNNDQKSLKPSVDTDIHRELYKYLKNVKCIIHTHSEYSTIIAQSNIEPKCYGTTHADYFYDKIPLSDKIYRVNKDGYEKQLGKSIISRLKRSNKYNPGILLRDHGLIAWGQNEYEAMNNLIAIEFICKIYYKTKMLTKKPKISSSVHNFHYERKHGLKSYYGQKNKIK